MLFIAVMQLLVATTISPPPAPPQSGGIRVLKCHVNSPHYNVYQVDPYGRAYAQQGKGTTASITFVNTGHQVATAIDFGLAVQSVLVAEMHNNGKFSPDVPISQTLGISNASLQAKNPRCLALKAKWADGTEWKSPELHTLTPLNH